MRGLTPTRLFLALLVVAAIVVATSVTVKHVPGATSSPPIITDPLPTTPVPTTTETPTTPAAESVIQHFSVPSHAPWSRVSFIASLSSLGGLANTIDTGVIRTVRPDGSGALDIARGRLTQFSYSPDGRQIAYVIGPPQQPLSAPPDAALYVANSDGSNRHKVAGQVSEDCTPSWSPDGSQIAYGDMRAYSEMSGYGYTFSALAVAKSDGSGTRVVREDISVYDSSATCFSYSPISNEIAYASVDNQTGNFVIRVVVDDGLSEPRQIISDVKAESPTFSPDGKYLAFVVAHLNAAGTHQDQEVWVAAATGLARPYPVSSVVSGEWSPVWSPNSRKLAFVSTRDDNSLWIINRDGSDEHEVAQVERAAEGCQIAAFSPDSQKIVYFEVVDTGIGVATVGLTDASGHGKTTRLSSGAVPGAWCPVWAPTPSSRHKSATTPTNTQPKPTSEQAPADKSRWAHVAYIAALSNTDPAQAAIRVITPAGAYVSDIAKGAIVQFAFSPNGKRVAYIVASPETVGSSSPIGSVFIAGADGTHRQKVGTSALGQCGPSWSPDSSKLAYVTTDSASGTSSIVVSGLGAASAKTLNAWPLVDATGDCIAYSPTSSQIAYAYQDDTGFAHLYTVSDSGAGQPRRVTSGSGERYPAWSANGKKLAYYSLDGTIDVMSGSGGHSVVVAPSSLTPYGQPVWAPDGNALAFAENLTTPSLGVIGLKSSQSFAVASIWSVAESCAGAAYSPDSVHLVYVVLDPQTPGNRIWKVTYDRSPTQLSATSKSYGKGGREFGASCPTWAP